MKTPVQSCLTRILSGNGTWTKPFRGSEPTRFVVVRDMHERPKEVVHDQTSRADDGRVAASQLLR